MGTDVVVIGAGSIGAAVAWRCAVRGLTVTLVDPGSDTQAGAAHLSGPVGAWHTAAGMLAPITELHYAERDLLALGLASLARWQSFAADLTDASGRPTGWRRCGTVAVAWDGADLAALRDLHAFGRLLGVDAELLSGRDLRDLEPELTPGLPGGLLAPGDHQVDPRRLHDALTIALDRAGVVRIADTAAVEVQHGRAVGVRLADGTQITAGSVVLAAGAWSGTVAGVPPEFVPPVRPVKGTTLRLHLGGSPRLSHVVRGTIKGAPIYLVPRPDGEIVVGATSEERGFDTVTRAGAVYELLRDAQSLLPELGEASVVDVSTGLRPGSPDNAPLIGRSGLDGLVIATGHYRNGILLTPITADAIADLVAGDPLPEALHPFRPDRFGASAPVPAW